MLSGNWKNIDELEEHLNYQEIVLMVKASRDRDQRLMKFQAALKGINLDESKAPEEDPVEKMKRKIRAKQQGVDEESLRFKESATAAGFKVISK